jgi:hypothetical protein
MKKILVLILTLLISFNSFADCRPLIESTLEKKIIKHGKLVKAGKITTGAVFVTVGGFWGTMGVIMLGPLWAGAVIGASFGAFVGVPVGTTFVIVSKIQKHKIKNLGKALSIIGSGEELNNLHEKLLVNHSELSLSQLEEIIQELNETKALCDGTVSGKRRKIANPKEIYKYIDKNLSPY